VKTTRGRLPYSPLVNSKLGALFPPLVAGSLVTAAAVRTLPPFLLGLVEVIRGAGPESVSNGRRPAAALPRRYGTAARAGIHRSNPIPGFGNRKETNT
jgi:hypothetical protein